MHYLHIQDVSKFYGNLCVLDHLNFDIDEHEFIVVLGPSGSGKTTLLKVLCQLETQDDGDILVERCLHDIKKTMFFQSYALFPYLNVYDNIAIALLSSSLSTNQISQRIYEIARFLDIDHLLTRKIKQISGGQAQRVALARTMASDASLCLMDEPLSHLDDLTARKILPFIKKIHQKKQWTTLYVTHNQKEAQLLADRVIVMNHGKIEQLGTYETLYHDPKTLFVAQFMGENPMNLIKGHMRNGQFQCKDFSLPVLFKQEKDVILGIHVEDISWSCVKNEYPAIILSMNRRDHYMLLEVDCLGVLLQVITFQEPEKTKNIYLQFNRKKFYIFDQQSQLRLYDREK